MTVRVCADCGLVMGKNKPYQDRPVLCGPCRCNLIGLINTPFVDKVISVIMFLGVVAVAVWWMS